MSAVTFHRISKATEPPCQRLHSNPIYSFQRTQQTDPMIYPEHILILHSRGTPVEPARAPRSKPKWSSPQQAIDAKMIDEGCTASAMAASEAVRKKCAKFRATLEAELKKIQKRVSSSENSLQLNKHHYVGIAATFVFSWLLWRFCLTQSKATFDQALLEEI